MNKYLIRHKILEELHIEETRINKEYDLTDTKLSYELEIAIGVEEIRKLVGFTEYEIETQLIYLVHAGEVKGFYEDPCMRYLITDGGRLAISDEKYLKANTADIRERNKEFRAILSARVSLISTVIGLTLAILTMGINTCATVNNSKGQDQINNKLDSLLKKSK